MTYRLSARSERQLATCVPPLQALVRAAITNAPVDFTVQWGHRPKDAQNDAYARGASKVRWPNSDHNKLPSPAVDLVVWKGGKMTWDWPDYHRLAPHIKETWAELPASVTDGWRLEWGYDLWGFDGPHWRVVRED